MTVVTRDPPGEACSAGNSGGFGVSLIAPVATPGILSRIPSLWLDPRKPLAIEVSLLPRLLPWFARFVSTSTPARYRAASRARASLCERVFEALDPLLQDAGAEGLVRPRGMMFVYESEESLAAARPVHDVARAHGVPLEELDADSVRNREPALGARARCGVVSSTTRHTTNPRRLVRMLAADFRRRGGRVVEAEVRAVEGGERPQVVLAEESIAAQRIVVAAGVWSGSLVRHFGLRVLLAAERGYHLMAPGDGVRLTAPVTLSDRNVVLTPMEHGIRVTGMAEFARVDSPPERGARAANAGPGGGLRSRSRPFRRQVVDGAAALDPGLAPRHWTLPGRAEGPVGVRPRTHGARLCRHHGAARRVARRRPSTGGRSGALRSRPLHERNRACVRLLPRVRFSGSGIGEDRHPTGEWTSSGRDSSREGARLAPVARTRRTRGRPSG